MRNFRVFAFYSLLSLICRVSMAAPSSAPPASWIVDFDHATGSTEFHAKGHPSALRINGHGTAPTGQLNWQNGKVKGTLSFDLSTLDTGMSLRNKHMKEKYLEVEKYPKARLILSDLSLPSENMSQDFSLEKVPFSGKLALHGVEQSVNGLANIERKGQTIHIEAEFAVKINDFGITQPSFAGITVADDVTVHVEADPALHAPGQ